MGGTYDAFQTILGAYAIHPDGLRFFPTYMAVSGFNGLLGLTQVVQAAQQVPFQFIPTTMYLPPLVSLCAAYFAWEFGKEVKAISYGYTGDGTQDSCFVRSMAGDWWPMSLPGTPETNLAGDPGRSAG